MLVVAEGHARQPGRVNGGTLLPPWTNVNKVFFGAKKNAAPNAAFEERHCLFVLEIAIVDFDLLRCPNRKDHPHCVGAAVKRGFYEGRILPQGGFKVFQHSSVARRLDHIRQRRRTVTKDVSYDNHLVSVVVLIRVWMRISTCHGCQRASRIQTGRLFTKRCTAPCQVFRSYWPVKIVRGMSRLQHANDTVLKRGLTQRNNVRTQRSKHQRKHDHRCKRTDAVGHQPWLEEMCYATAE